MNANEKVALITSKQGTRLGDCTSTRSKGCTVLLGARDLTRGTEATETLKELETFESRSTMPVYTITHAAKTIEAEFGEARYFGQQRRHR